MSKAILALPPGFVTPDKKHLGPAAYLFLFLLCLGFFVPGLASLPPTDRDESSFAQASKQMIETGNYVDIRLQSAPRYKKPIGIYWLQATSVKLFDPGHLNEIWAYRLPSFAGATLAVLLTAALGTLLFGPMTGLLAAIMMAGCVVLNTEARLAKTDAVLLATIMAAQYALARTYLKQTKSIGMPVLFWTALAAGILIKGPIILLVVLPTIAWLRVTDKNLKWFAVLRPWMGIPYTVILILPWLAAIGIASHGQFYQQSAGHDMFGKVLSGEFRGVMPPGLHLLVFPAVFFPFSLFALLAIPDAWKYRHEAPVRFCLGWIIPAWILFELSLTKLPHYVLPMYPAIAMLAARAMLGGFKGLSAPGWRWLPPVALSAWLLAGTGIAFAPLVGWHVLNGNWNGWLIAASAILLITQGVAVFFLFQQNARGILVLTAGSMLFFACVFGITLPGLQHIWLSQEVYNLAVASNPCRDVQITSASYDEPSLVFLAGTRTRFVPSGAMASLSLWVNPCNLVLTDPDHDKDFLRAFRKGRFTPTMLGTVKGYNAGRGNTTVLTLYTMPYNNMPSMNPLKKRK